MGTSRTGWRLALVAAATAGMTAVAQTAFAHTAFGAAAPPAGAPTTVVVDTAHPGGRLPADFAGLSFEERELGTGGFTAGQGNLVALFRGLNHAGNVRIAGNTLDRDTLWVPAGKQPPSPLPPWVQDVVTPADIQRLDGFLRATDWRAEVGINVGHWDPALAADQARTMTATLGTRLQATECGNEPNGWVGKGLRPPGFGYPLYKPDWEACAAAVGTRRIAGPDTSSPTSTAAWFDSFAHDEQARLSMLTVHNYSVPATATIADLLSAHTDASQLAAVSSELTSAKAVNLPVRVDETNSAAGGGVRGVSDTYASALWVLNDVLEMAQAGFAGVNLHGGLGVCGAPLYNGKFQLYTPICAANDADAAAKVYHAMPEYYGLWLAGRLGPGRFLPVRLTTDRNVTAYATRGDDGRTRLIIIDKDDVSSGPVPVDVTAGGQVAKVLHLTGTSLAGTATAIQGLTVDRRGHLYPHADRVPVRSGTLHLDLAGGSAVLVTLG